MRRLTRFKRSTAASKAWMPKLWPQCRCQAPQPRSGAPKAQGLIAALRPQHNPPCPRSLPTAVPAAGNVSTGAAAFTAPQLQSRISTSLTDVTSPRPRAQLLTPCDWISRQPGSALLGLGLSGWYDLDCDRLTAVPLTKTIQAIGKIFERSVLRQHERKRAVCERHRHSAGARPVVMDI